MYHTSVHNFVDGTPAVYRSSQRYESRVNDLPVGFNLGPENPLTTSGLSYEYNKSYCDSFFDEWSAAQKNCLVAGAASVVGWILIIVAIFDLVLGFWDPLGFNSKYPKELLPQLVEQSEFALKQQLGSVEVELPFFTLANLILGQQELAVTSIETLPYIYEYLSSLDVNADGTRIDKGDEISNETAPSFDETIAKTKLYSPEELHEFEKVHARRLTFYKTGPTALLIMAGVFCACLVLGVWIGCIIAAILVGLLSFSLFANSVVGVFSTLDNIGIKL
ncbi:uncharacterized protein LOC134544898 [Bacillus rossius redtenbacheri]|uniref:uncharacterized protein LOC134544898 n=1 Tax=Bacillus rossius redtenbacheri TaxID=93214 RepID=UPI002FDE7C9F